MERQSHIISEKAVYKTIWIVTNPFKTNIYIKMYIFAWENTLKEYTSKC